MNVKEKIRYMKKDAVGILAFLLLLVFTACGSNQKAGTSLPDGNKEEEQKLSLGENKEYQDYLEDKYKSVLLGDADFICADLKNQSLNIKNIRQVITEDDSVTIDAIKFAVIDLDGDGKNEVVLWLRANGSSDVGFEVLYSRDETIYGITQYYRAFLNLKTDGTFTFSGGSADYGIGRLTFSDTGYDIDTPAYSQSMYNADNELTVQYFINGASCSEDEFYSTMDKQDQKEDVTWHDFSVDTINTAFDALP